MKPAAKMQLRHYKADLGKLLAPFRPIQKACDQCSQGVMDADSATGPGNDHLYGRCSCECHR
jgi:hypothetical protein